jgi:hypothetical protein
MRTQRSLYHRANGCNYEATKIFMPANREKPVYAKYIEHIPPDVTAANAGSCPPKAEIFNIASETSTSHTSAS